MTISATQPMPWEEIDTVLLDMDGTLLDLNFDTYFWTEHVPQRYAEKNGIAPEQAKAQLYPRFHAVAGTMDWYCLDYWTRELGLDIALLKEEVDHLIAVHPQVPEFLERLRGMDKRVVLVTNAHMKSLALKMERTRLAGHFDAIVCSHDFRLPKEDPAFWERMQQREPFAPRRTLLVDDSLPVLRAAQSYGIAHLRAVSKPDSRQPLREVTEFPAIADFGDIMPLAE
ncbi:GMP/IMP nucleotidase [Sulfurivermis fontis]|uniref:GMP/IMP nucleotidase n=1 Tax=Sulfurivermis fontis TaxID=1972068 RepID=UPI000FDB256D|nr:GMP/IMP nucleotidase [Sulfurivermis fontis]